MQNANSIVTLDELKSVAPDGFDTSNTDYDNIFMRLGISITRWAEKLTGRKFYPESATRYFDSIGGQEIYVDDLISVTNLYYSDDDGENYTEISSDDFNLMVGKDRNSKESYTMIRLHSYSSLGEFPTGDDAIKIIGIWNFVDDRDNYFIASGDSVVDAPLAADATTIEVNDADATDAFGFLRFSRGQLIRIESEQIEITAINTTTNVMTVIRGVNGTTAAAHVATTPIYKMQYPDDLKQACIIQAVHQFKRGQAAFGDAQAIGEAAKIVHIKTIDPEALELLSRYKMLQYG